MLMLAVGSVGLAACATTSRQAEITGVPLRVLRDPLIEGRRVAVLTEDWFYCYPPSRELILVPRGYMTDFASVPKISPFAPFGKHAEAAIVHDWLYAVGEPNQRQKADEIFRYAMAEQKVPVMTRNAMYEAVRLGGEAAYGRATEWMKRFANPATGEPEAPRFKKPASAIVQPNVDCRILNSQSGLKGLRERYRSVDWPRA
ncbi:DUF1353 domain-containing protein [Caulobacter sp. Root487D2Y]|uniref:DUF1353 domain-containing protein n=1 Tax=Caulobacter sp. Root487D2Y TaxID=1736547 RepID=UPI00138EEEF9|nr:DUF1353 domain-containing protein [Caulobacter sp. Root487D2Y]